MRDFESEARKEGWVPEEEFKGDNRPTEFVDAQTFIERGERSAGILKQKVDTLSAEVERLKTSHKDYGEFNRRFLDKERKQYDQRLKELEAQREQAISEGDGQTFTKADQQIKQLERPPQDISPDAQAWVNENAWYNADEQMRDYADGLAPKLIQQGFRGTAYWQELTKRSHEAFPHKFNNPRRNDPQTVETDGKDEKEPEPRSFSALPPEAKAVFQQFKEDFGMTQKEYLDQYDWS